MSRAWFKLGRREEPAKNRTCAACPLTACARGCRAAVIRMECAGEEARRLRNMGLYEGSCIMVVDHQDGYLLDVCGSRLALGRHLAGSITVLPLAG